jgi:hypothetical protein
VLQTLACRSFVQHVDGFVGQVTLGQVPLPQVHRCFHGAIGDGEMVELLEALLETFENLDGIGNRRLVDHDGLEAAFQSAVMSTVVSENPVHMEEYGVQTGQGTRIEIFLNTGDKPDIDGFIGKRGPNYTDSFFRLEGQNRVYLVGGMPTFIFPSEIDSYRLKRLLRSDPHDAVSFSFSYGTTQLHLQKSSDTWTNTDAHVAVSAEWMVQLKEKIKAISVVSYTDEPAQPVHGLDKPGLTVGISWMNEKRTLLFGKEKKSPPPGRYAQVDGRPALYVVASAPVKDLLDFLKTVPSRP